MSDSSHAGGAANGDWFEITNTGDTSLSLAGYYWDDDGPAGNDGAFFPSISILPSESLVIVSESTANLPTFVSAWGGGFTAVSEDSFTGPDTFSGLSGNGDQIQIWDSDPNAGPATLITSVFFGEATTGSSFEWATGGTPLGLSVDGENGAFVATEDGAGGAGTDIGSPGIAVAVPEPSTLLLGATGLLALLRRRR